MKNINYFVCPSGDFTCPYFDANNGGNCTMYPEFDPVQECDDAAYYCGEEEDD